MWSGMRPGWLYVSAAIPKSRSLPISSGTNSGISMRGRLWFGKLTSLLITLESMAALNVPSVVLKFLILSHISVTPFSVVEKKNEWCRDLAIHTSARYCRCMKAIRCLNLTVRPTCNVTRSRHKIHTTIDVFFCQMICQSLALARMKPKQ